MKQTEEELHNATIIPDKPKTPEDRKLIENALKEHPIF
jgi:hypothetical protein